MSHKSLVLEVLNSEFLISLFENNYDSYVCSNVLGTIINRRAMIDSHRELTGTDLKVTSSVIIDRPTMTDSIKASTVAMVEVLMTNLKWISLAPIQCDDQHKIYAKIAREQIEYIGALSIQKKEQYVTALIVCFKLQIDIKKDFGHCEDHTRALRELFDIDMSQVHSQFSTIQNHTNMIELLLVSYIKLRSEKIENIDQCQLYANHIVQTRAKQVKYVSKVNEVTLWAMTAYLMDAKKWFVSPFSTSKANAHMYIVLDYFKYKLELPTMSRRSVGDIMTYSTALDKSYFMNQLASYGLKKITDMEGIAISSLSHLVCRGGVMVVDNRQKIEYLILVTGAAYNNSNYDLVKIRNVYMADRRFANDVKDFFGIKTSDFEQEVGRCLVSKMVDLYDNRLFRRREATDILMKEVVVNDPPLESEMQSTRIRNASRLLAIIRDAGLSLQAHKYLDVTLIIHSYKEINSTEIMFVLSMCNVSVVIVGQDQMLLYSRHTKDIKTIGRETESMEDVYEEIFNYFGESPEEKSLTIHFYILTTNKAHYSKSDTVDLVELVNSYTDEIENYTYVSDMNYNVVEVVLPDVCGHMAEPMRQWNSWEGHVSPRESKTDSDDDEENDEHKSFMTYRDLGISDERMCCDKVKHAINYIMELMDTGMFYLIKSGVQHGHNMAMLVIRRCSGFNEDEDAELIREHNELITTRTLKESMIYDRMRNVSWGTRTKINSAEDSVTCEIVRDLRNKFKRKMMGLGTNDVEKAIEVSLKKLRVLSNSNK